MDKEQAVRILKGEELATPEQMLKATSMAVKAFCGSKPMVRCRDCKWWELIPDNENLPAWHRCIWFNGARTRYDDFCNRGERRLIT